jgi:hypothetical protein
MAIAMEGADAGADVEHVPFILEPELNGKLQSGLVASETTEYGTALQATHLANTRCCSQYWSLVA